MLPADNEFCMYAALCTCETALLAATLELDTRGVILFLVCAALDASGLPLSRRRNSMNISLRDEEEEEGGEF